MRRTLVAALVLSLVAGSLAAPALAGKKKKKTPPPPAPVAEAVTFWFHNDPAACAAENYTLQLVEATAGSNCGSAASGVANEALVTAGEAPLGMVYNATEGVPFVLDATQKITGTIYVASHSGEASNPAGLAAGPATLVAEVIGTIAGEETSLGIAEVDYLVTPASKVYEVKFELEVPAELDKSQVDSLSISLYNRGFTVALHGFYRVQNPASNFTVSTWK